MKKLSSFNRKCICNLVLFFLISAGTASLYAQNPCNSSSRYLYWTGEENNDFFNENNWRLINEKPNPPGKAKATSGTDAALICLPGANSFPYSICRGKHDATTEKHPKEGTLTPGLPIDYNMLIESASVNASGDIIFACAQKGLTILGTQLNISNGTMSAGVLSMKEESTVHFRSGSFSPRLILNFLDNASWVYIHQQNPDQLSQNITNVYVQNVSGSQDHNFRVQQYYETGALIRPASSSLHVLTIFEAANRQGNNAGLQEDIIYSGSAIPGGLDNNTGSFILKRGYMATVAINDNGTGKSKVYIASEADLTVNTLDVSLQQNISFIRVVPWNWTTKKGTGGIYPQVDAGWYYNWGLGSTSQPNYEYVPMAWGAGGASPASINDLIRKKKTTHLLGFNESDNCSGESGQYNNLCQPAVAVAYYENLMSTGVRLGSPAPRENGPTTWLLEFARIAKEKNVRFDFVAVHWYDWGSNPAGSPNASAEQIFNRFKLYLENVYRIYQLPVWITEFNANPNRGNTTQEAFLRLALPYLDTLRFVERYAYFQPNPAFAQNQVETAYYLNPDSSLTNIGTLYKNHRSVPSIDEATMECPNNLSLDLPYTAPPSSTQVFEAECNNSLGNKWNILPHTNASNGFYIRGDDNLPGATAIAKQLQVDFDLSNPGSYRVWIRAASAGGNGALRFGIDGKATEQITPFNSSSFTWFQVPRFYDLGEGKHRLTLEFPNANLLLDQIAIVNESPNLDALKKDSGFCTPSLLRWGLAATDLLSIQEGENGTKGMYWSAKTNANAKAGAYAGSEEGITDAAIPEGSDKILSFSFNIQQADEYDIWAKIQALATGENSFWISVDNEPFRKWNHLGNSTFEWYWKKFHFSYPDEDRSLTYFLEAGTHTVRVAIASGTVSVDRIAVSTKGKLPENTDPNVLLLAAKLEFEAEDATILGAAAIVNCSTSSNGKQVNLSNLNSNGVRFNQIVAESAGAYTLKVSYISAVARSFRLIVNGTTLARQTVAISGGWCFNGGSPGIYQITVLLKRGLNNIDITPFSGDAPFIDKIKLERAPLNGLSLEAETAELAGSSAIVTCTTSSNGALVNMGATASNAIRFNDILVNTTGNYLVDIHYISGADRNMRVSLNGEPFTTQSFITSGAWCFAGGSPKVKTVEMTLVQGNNSIEFRPTGVDAPFIDKIVIREPVNTSSAETIASSAIMLKEDITKDNAVLNELLIYPNPSNGETALTILLPAVWANQQKPLSVQLSDITGRTVFTGNKITPANRQIKLQQKLGRGTYIVLVTDGIRRYSQKLIIQ